MNVAPDLLNLGTELDDSVDQLHELLEVESERKVESYAH